MTVLHLQSPGVRADAIDHLTRHVTDTLTENFRAQQFTSAEVEIVCAVLSNVLTATQKLARRNRLELAFREAVGRTALAAVCGDPR